MGREITEINAGLPETTRINRFALLFKELDADDGELTRTRKLRRKVVEERYHALIEALYGPDVCLELKAAIQYQDGRTREMSGNIAIACVE